jgi:hypothetical protein
MLVFIQLTASYSICLYVYCCVCFACYRILTDAIEQQLWVPGPYAIAHHLMALWADRDDIFSEPISTADNSSNSSGNSNSAAAAATSAVGKL